MKKKNLNEPPFSIVMMGASGAVGGMTIKELISSSKIARLTLLNRRNLSNLSGNNIHQKEIDVSDPKSYIEYVTEHNIAICTLGVGQPSKINREEFIKIDKIAVLNFAKACKNAGVRHFELLAAVGINSNASNFYARIKGELVDELKLLNFERLSVFEPSMILTPSNRYGFSQAILLWIWPFISLLLFGGLRKYKGIHVEKLGKAIAVNIQENKSGFESLAWDEFQTLTK